MKLMRKILVFGVLPLVLLVPITCYLLELSAEQRLRPSPPFNIKVNYQTTDVKTGKVFEKGSATLMISEKGPVCSSTDDGRPHTTKRDNGDTKTTTTTCSGTYNKQDGTLSYTQTVASETYTGDGTTCTVDTPYHLTYAGKFSTFSQASGTIGKVMTTLHCGTNPVVTRDIHGTWKGEGQTFWNIIF